MSKRQIKIQKRAEAIKKTKRSVREEARSAADRLASLSLTSPIPSLRAKAQKALAALNSIARGELDAARVTEVSAVLEAISGGANS
jgi:hypothetical protein